MEKPRENELNPSGTRSQLTSVNVQVVSEHFYCPRAGLLAYESEDDTEDEEPRLGPRLDGFADYDKHRFAEELQAAWDSLVRLLTLVAPALLLVLGMFHFVSLFWAAMASWPLIYFTFELWGTFMRIASLRREHALFEAAPVLEVDREPKEHYQINWWSLRKAGFDCRKPADSHSDHEQRLAGRPWRILTKDTTLHIPVVRKHRGGRKWGRQHVIRVAAYCHLLKVCQLADAPFGVLMFNDSYECVVIPNTSSAQLEFWKALEDAREFLAKVEQDGYKPPAPTDNRCKGCNQGKPRRYVPGESETVLKGERQVPILSKARNGKHYHCNCQDRFDDAPPPHEKAVWLGIARPRA